MTNKPTPASQQSPARNQDTNLTAEQIGKAINSVHFSPSPARSDKDAERPLLPVLDDDDEVAFPNDTGLAVIHADYYWKLRGCEDVCAALGVPYEKLVSAERAPSGESLRFSFELDAQKWLGTDHAIGRSSFALNDDGTYQYAATRRLFDFWHAARRATAGTTAAQPQNIGRWMVHCLNGVADAIERAKESPLSITADAAVAIRALLSATAGNAAPTGDKHE